MSEHLHPDPDSLNAFIEGVLPEHERLECLAHLADCARCREIVYLAQEPVASATIAADPVPFWKRWFAPIPVLAAAVVCALLVSLGIYRLSRPKRVEPVVTAFATPRFEPPTPAPALVKQKPVLRSRRLVAPAVPVVSPPVAAPVIPAAPPPPPPPVAAVVAGGATSGIAGTVTDPAGGVVPGAVVTAHPVAGTSFVDTRTDGKGQFTLAGLPPGPYELQIQSPGFKEGKKQVDLQPETIARADSTLQLGAFAETVTVINGAPLLKTESGEVSGAIAGSPAQSSPRAFGNLRNPLPAELPGKAAPPTAASKDKLMLKADSAGVLFFSKNSGKSWKTVKPKWQGKVVRVEPAKAPGAVFQITTDSGSVWLSHDGTHWNE